MTTTLKPRDRDELRDTVAWALNDGKTLEIVGAASKRALGRPVVADHGLDLSGIAGVVEYQPEELVITVRAGTPMREVEALLAQRNQMLAFEPPDLGPLLGGVAEASTLAGAVLCNLAGPRRLSAGAARDHLLGFSAVNGRGEIFKSGGKVMKNVTGYDLSKLMAGSFGTLAALDEINVKVLPAPDKTRTLLLFGLADADAIAAMALAMGSPHEVSGAAHLPADAARRSAVGYVAKAGGSATALRLEGVGPSVEARLTGLRDLLTPVVAAKGGAVEELHTMNSRALWRELRDVTLLGAASDALVWRLSCPPSEGAAVVARIRAVRPDVGAIYDWAGGQIWLSLPPTADADHALVRAALAACGGHATLIRAPGAVRAAVPVFQPQAPALAALAWRVKESFDPRGVFNPGRMG